LLDVAVNRIKRQVSPRQFQIFDCYALKGWPVPDVVKHLKVTEQQVYTAKHRIAALLQEQLHQLETRML
jgi:RNA polymerase sigma-70 factor (ECF subfamily)